MQKIYAAVFLLMFSNPLLALDESNLKAFPPAEKGMIRHVLNLTQHDAESTLKVEIIVGKTLSVDSNRYFFNGQIKPETIKGWGFTRYTVSTLGLMAGTLMAVDPNIPKTDQFITLGAEPYLIRYNSRLPIVVYVPQDAEVRYRIWSAGDFHRINQE